MNINAFFIYSVSIVLYSGCAMHTDTGSPSQNNSLNAISPAGNGKGGYLQQSYDKWEKEEWEPNTGDDSKASEVPEAKDDTQVTNENICTDAPSSQKDANSSEDFTLQYYMDKWNRYMENKEKNETGPSNVEKLDTMPAIGSPDAK